MLDDLNTSTIFYFVVGFGYSIIVGHLVIKSVLDTYYTGHEEGRQKQKWRAAVVGFVERTLYLGSILANKPEFIAIWLAFKIAGQWDRWKTDYYADPKKRPLLEDSPGDTARAVWGGYAIGNGLSIAFAFTGGVIIQLLVDSNLMQALFLGISLLILCLFLHLYIRHHVKKSTKV